MDPVKWAEVWLYYTGEVHKGNLREEPRVLPPSTWTTILAIDSLIVQEWTGDPREVGDKTVKLVISVKL